MMLLLLRMVTAGTFATNTFNTDGTLMTPPLFPDPPSSMDFSNQNFQSQPLFPPTPQPPVPAQQFSQPQVQTQQFNQPMNPQFTQPMGPQYAQPMPVPPQQYPQMTPQQFTPVQQMPQIQPVPQVQATPIQTTGIAQPNVPVARTGGSTPDATEVNWFKEMLAEHNRLRAELAKANSTEVTEQDIQDLRQYRTGNPVDSSIARETLPPLCISNDYYVEATKQAKALGGLDPSAISTTNPHTYGGDPGQRYQKPGEGSPWVTESIAYCEGPCTVKTIVELLKDIGKAPRDRGHYSNILTKGMTSVSMGQFRDSRDRWWWVLVYSTKPCANI